MYNVYGVYADTYRDACLIAGCDGPDHDFEEEYAIYEYNDIKDELDGISFDVWRAGEKKRAYLPDRCYHIDY